MDNTQKNIVALGLVILVAEYAFVICDGISFTKYHYNGNAGHKHAPNEKVIQDETKDPFTCGKLCHIDGNCNSFSYQPGTGMCIGCSALHCGVEPTDSSEESAKTTFYSTIEEPSGPDPAVLLTGGRHEYEGRLEVQYNGQWGTVCNDSFDAEEARVVCNNMLNITTADAKIYPGAHFSQRTLPILLGDVSCSGSEKNLLECSHRGWGESACRHGRDVGISCTPIGLEPFNGNDNFGGMFKVQYNGQWGTVCMDHFGPNEAMVACNMLNLPRAFAKTCHWQDFFSAPSTLPIIIGHTACTGSEKSLFECPHKVLDESDLCLHNGNTCVFCVPELHIRLAGGTAPHEGRVEVSLDGIQWGTMCGNSNIHAIETVCRMLGYKPYQAVGEVGVNPGTGPIFLAHVFCKGPEESLLFCLSLGWNVTACDHDRDLSVVCTP